MMNYTEQELQEAREHMKANVKKEVRDFNRPYKYAVAINCSHLGDDNDYSCFLSNVIEKLYTVDRMMAWKLFRTDSMCVDNDISFDDFCRHVEESIERGKEIEKMYSARPNWD